jgi:two-component system, response regulator RpfG
MEAPYKQGFLQPCSSNRLGGTAEMPTVVLLDTDPRRREELVRIMGTIDPQLQVEAFDRCEQALSWLYWHQADLILADTYLQDIEAVPLIARIRDLPNGIDVPLLMLTAHNDLLIRHRVLEVGATDYLNLPLDPLECRARCYNLLTQYRQQRIIHERARWLEQRVSEATSEIRLREQDTGNHVVRMAKYSRLIAESLGMTTAECESIELAAPMHDIGKIGIPDEILRKPGKLTTTEFEVMKNHARIGYEILKDSPSEYLQMGAIIALGHHERYDGSGYPNGLRGEDIPLMARIVSVVQYMATQRCLHFDPECLDAFNSRLDRVTKIQYLLGDELLTKQRSM